MRVRVWLIWTVLALALITVSGACRTPSPGPAEMTAAAGRPTDLDLTYTPPAVLPQPSLTPAAPAVATGVPTATPTIPFEATVVELRVRVPAIGLDRRLQGNVSGDVVLVDETTGTAVQRNNQPGLLIQLQQILPSTSLAELPAGCATCVELTYELPFENQSGQGWLQDERLLSSLENYFAIALDAHFPPNTLVGLRRSASPYAPAHTLALTADGLLWSWLATDGQPAPGVDANAAAPGVVAAYNALAPDALRNSYVIACEGGVPIEELQIAAGGETRQIDVVCPEFAIPTPLLPLYAALDEATAVLLADVGGPDRPPSAFPLTAVLDYRRPDSARLTVYQDGRTEATAPGRLITTTLTLTEVISLTTPLLDSGQLSSDLTLLGATPEATGSVPAALLVRGSDRVYAGRWPEPIALLASLNSLLDQLLARPEVTPTAEPSPNG